MDPLLHYLSGAAAFVTHGFCLLWRPGLVAMHAVSDGVIALVYFSIPAAIFMFVRRRPDFRHRRVALLFIVFIVLCGVTHAIGVWTLWQPVYGLQGLIKALAATVSLLTAVVLWRMLPRLLALPTPALLAEKATRLEAEIARRGLVEQALRTAQANLEERVAERTRELGAAKAEAEHMALHDGLTLIANRRLMQRQLAAALAESRRGGRKFALLVIDLDAFKAVNDTYGHPAGDALLVEVARRLLGCVRQYDLVARFGGDEFAILAPSCHDEAAAGALAERVVAALDRPFCHGYCQLRAAASVGVALGRPDLDGPASLLTEADRAAYAAKRAGGNRWQLFRSDHQGVFSPAPNSPAPNSPAVGSPFAGPPAGPAGAQPRPVTSHLPLAADCSTAAHTFCVSSASLKVGEA